MHAQNRTTLDRDGEYISFLLRVASTFVQYIVWSPARSPSVFGTFLPCFRHRVYLLCVCCLHMYHVQKTNHHWGIPGPWYTLVFGSLPLTAAMDARIRPSTTCTAYSSSLYSVLSTRFPRFFDVFRFRCRTRSMYHLQQTSNGCGNLQISYVAHVPLTAVTCVRPSLACTR